MRNYTDSDSPSVRSTNYKELQIEKVGGPEERSKKSKLRIKTRFPAAEDDFYPAEKTQEQLIGDTVRRVEDRRRKRTPAAVSEVTLTENTITVNGRSMKQIYVHFTTQDTNNFDRARIWVKGYGTEDVLGQTTNSEEHYPFELIKTVEKSPAVLLLELSGDTILIAVEAVNDDGIASGKTTMPTVTTKLT